MTKHYYNEPERSNALARNYDYVIVGTGSAGCVVARRQIDSTDATVLLLEAGGSDGRCLRLLRSLDKSGVASD